MASTQTADMRYLGRCDLDLAHSSDDVRGMIVVDPNGHRLGEVEDLVIDADERRTRLLSVVSGGIAGLRTCTRLIPIETIARVDDRVHLDRDHADVHAQPVESPGDRPASDDRRQPGRADLASCAAAYDRYGVPAFWEADSSALYFHRR